MSFFEAELLRAAFLRCLQQDNDCSVIGRPCHPDKCGCDLEMQTYLDEARDALVGENAKP